MDPWFALDTSLVIGIVLAFLAGVIGLLVLFGTPCAHEYLRCYDPEHRRSYLSCARCGHETQGWTYGQRHSDHDQDAA